MSTIAIAGAGPVGLWLAAELRLRGQEVVVLESKADISLRSKALTIHPRTIEVLSQRGVAAAFLEEGLRVPSGHFGGLKQRLDFAELDTPFPFTLLLPQARTEQILQTHAVSAGVDLRREHTVTGVAAGAEHVDVTVAGPESTYTLRADFLVGCDGAGSAVRQLSGIGFPGTDASTWGILADVTLSDPPAGIYDASDTSGQLMIVPFEGGHRVLGIDPLRQEPMTGALSFEEFRQSVIDIAGTDFGMHSPRWISRYGNASRVADRYAVGRVALAGDAAHMHFPAGGVGMNVGIQDAHALGWRIADAAAGFAGTEILRDYHDERHPVGVDLVLGTQAQTAVMAAFDEDRQGLRQLLTQLIAQVPNLRTVLAERLAGLSVAYPPRAGGHVLEGRRLGLLPSDEPTTAAARRGDAILFDPQGVASSLADELERRGITAVQAQPRMADPATSGRELAPALALMRPDGHVAWASDDSRDLSALSAAVDTFRRSA